MKRLDVDSPRQHALNADGYDWAVWEWPGEGRPLLFMHATGFHAQCWRRVIEHFPGRRVIAVDAPNHGRSERQPTPFSWPRFASGLVSVIQQLQLQDVTGVGHSMGAHVMTLACGLNPAAFAGLVLVDPVILEPQFAATRRGRMAPEDNPVARRRNHWASPEQMFDAFKDRKPFCDWDPAVLRDYCNGGLRHRADGDGFELACSPLDEANVYAVSAENDVYDAIKQIDQPVQVIRGRLWDHSAPPGDFSNSPTWPELAAQFKRGIDDHLAERSHFFPMETPEWLARRIAGFEEAHL